MDRLGCDLEESEGIAAWIPQGEEGLTSAAGICERLQSEPTTLTDKELKRLVSRVPQVLGYDPSTLVPSLGALAARLDLSNDELKKKIVLRLPQICGYRFQEDVEPGLLALQEALPVPQRRGLPYEGGACHASLGRRAFGWRG